MGIALQAPLPVDAEPVNSSLTFPPSGELVDRALESCDLGLEAGDFGSDVDVPTLLGILLPPGPTGGLLGAGVAVPPPSPVLSLCSGGKEAMLGLGKVGDGATGFCVLIDAPAALRSALARSARRRAVRASASAGARSAGLMLRMASAVILVSASTRAAIRTLSSSASLATSSRVSASWSGSPVSMAQVGVRSVDQSRLRSSAPWARSSATRKAWVDSRALLIAT